MFRLNSYTSALSRYYRLTMTGLTRYVCRWHLVNVSLLCLLLGWVGVSISAHATLIEGNPKGAITLTEVYDTQCPHCQRQWPVIQALIKANPDLKVRLMPVAVINHRSLVQATMVLAAKEQPAIAQSIHQLSLLGMPLTVSDINGLMQRLHLQHPKFLQRMHSAEVRQQLLQGLYVLKRYQAHTVPFILIYPSGTHLLGNNEKALGHNVAYNAKYQDIYSQGQITTINGQGPKKYQETYGQVLNAKPHTIQVFHGEQSLARLQRGVNHARR